MVLNITTIKIDLTSAFRAYIERRFLPIGALIRRFDPMEGAELRVEVSRTTRHQRRGDVYFASATLRLSKATLRAERVTDDPRAAVDAVKDMLTREIRKYRTRFAETRRRRER